MQIVHYAVVDAGNQITISESIAPYRILPKVGIDTDGDGTDDKFEFAKEPSCQNAAKDDGLIDFDINGGDLPQGGIMPYEIKWEKYDVKQLHLLKWTDQVIFQIF